MGCGSGAVLATLAARLGSDHVAGIDPSESFVSLAQDRVPGADVRLGSAEALPFDDRSFDVVLSQLVINFMADAPRGVAEMARVSRGTVASCVWDYAGEMTMLRIFWDSALELDPDAPDEGRTMRWCTRPELRELWESAELIDIEVGDVAVGAAYQSFEDYWVPFLSGIGPSGAYCAALPPDGQAALREACRRRLDAPDGPFELTARAWVVTGRISSS